MPIKSFSDFLNEHRYSIDDSNKEIMENEEELVEDEECEDDMDESKKSEEYQEYFKSMLKKYGVEDPSELDSDEDKKKFFNDVDDGWDETKSQKA